MQSLLTLDFEFELSTLNRSIFLSGLRSSFITPLVRVIDIILPDYVLDVIQHVKTHIDKEFNIKNIGYLHYFFDI